MSLQLRTAGELVNFGSGVFPFSALFNHSCRPHAQWRPLSSGSAIVVHATRDVEAGEEIFVSYLPLSHIGTKRLKSLRETHGFICQCERCFGTAWLRSLRTRAFGAGSCLRGGGVPASPRASKNGEKPTTRSHLLLPDDPYDEDSPFRCRAPGCKSGA